MEVERHLMLTIIMIQFLGLFSMALILEEISLMYKRASRE